MREFGQAKGQRFYDQADRMAVDISQVSPPEKLETFETILKLETFETILKLETKKKFKT